MDINIIPKVVIEARVFRAKKEKPFLIPKSIWKWAKRKRIPGTGKWENKGVITTLE
jgi:hypothetical protein